jgi:hypothetical protein
VIDSSVRQRLKRMSYQHPIWLYLWIAPHLLLGAIAFVLFRRKLYKEVPVFFSYLVFEFLQFCVLFTMHALASSVTAYMKVDILCRAGSIAFRFGMLQEMFEAPVAHSVQLRRTVARGLNWVTAAMVILAVLFVGSLFYDVFGQGILQAYITIEGLNTAQCGLLALVFLWHRFLGLRMSPCIFGIALGMGLITGVEPAMHVLKNSVAPQNWMAVDILQMSTYHVAVLVWLYYVQVREKVVVESNAALPSLREHAVEMGRIEHL